MNRFTRRKFLRTLAFSGTNSVGGFALGIPDQQRLSGESNMRLLEVRTCTIAVQVNPHLRIEDIMWGCYSMAEGFSQSTCKLGQYWCCRVQPAGRIIFQPTRLGVFP